MEKGELVLTRSPGESVMIGDDIEVQVRKIQKGLHGPGKVRLCFIVPKNIPVNRMEIYNQIKHPSLPADSDYDGNCWRDQNGLVRIGL